MLFGDEKNQKTIMKNAFRIAKEKHIKPIFGASGNSLARGIYRHRSDYDVRFLFIRDNYPSQIYTPSQFQEKKIVYRFYPDKLISDFDLDLTFWETSAICYFLIEPSIYPITKDKNGLYQTVFNIFLSPYVWDPYGIQIKLYPLISSIYKKELPMRYYLKMCLENFNVSNINAKQYLRSIWSALSLDWGMKNDGIIPLNIEVLQTGISCYRAQKEISVFLSEIYRKSVVKEKNPLIERNAYIDQYIQHIRNNVASYLVTYNSDNGIDAEPVVQKIHKVIYASLHGKDLLNISSSKKTSTISLVAHFENKT